ncbi:hypothetical protein FRB91_001770 [Serendipita sp. 411]|nr:hypothetical protein FRB91_001770 [Serendipita sp. 411]
MSPQKSKARSPPQQEPSRHSSRLAALSKANNSPKTSSKQGIIGVERRKAPATPKASKPTKRGKKVKGHLPEVLEPSGIDYGLPDERASTSTPAPNVAEEERQPAPTIPTTTVPPEPKR